MNLVLLKKTSRNGLRMLVEKIVGQINITDLVDRRVRDLVWTRELKEHLASFIANRIKLEVK